MTPGGLLVVDESERELLKQQGFAEIFNQPGLFGLWKIDILHVQITSHLLKRTHLNKLFIKRTKRK